jgi:hypothetical protein
MLSEVSQVILAAILFLPISCLWLLAAGVEWCAEKVGCEVAHGWN